MARSGKFDYINESFEDVLNERNDMMKSEKVYRKRIRQLEEELKGMVNQCQMISNENKELRKTLDGIKRNGENSDVVAKLTKLESEKAKLAADYNAKLKQIDSVLEENAKFKKENAELESKVRELQQQVKQRGSDDKIRDLQGSIKDLQYENKALEAKIKSLEYDNKTLTNSLENKRKDFDELSRALQTETVTEANLKDVKENAGRIQEENDRVKQELMDAKKILRDSDISKQKLQEQLSEKDNKIKKLDIDNDKKHKMISDLMKDLEESRQKIQKLEESQIASKDMEKESLSLKSRIGSLKTEIDTSLAKNQRLKQDKEEMMQIIEKLHQENSGTTETYRESKKYLKNWEQETEYRAKVQSDLAKKTEEVQLLEDHLKEAENKVTVLDNKIKSLEDELVHLRNFSENDIETDNKVLKDGNTKLRQMLVERNIELTNTKYEQTVADFRIRNLERKKRNAEVRVQQLSQSFVSVTLSPVQEGRSPEATKLLNSSNKRNLPSELQTSNQSKNRLKQSKRHATFVLEESNKVLGDDRNQTTSSLPLLETKSVISPHTRSGYFTLYREKQKRVKEKGF